ncbi:phosphatase PAP2 family protein [Halosegnis sp.]|uniref:phosphatase PAP2 family protein n=1 Tax=Halosegnis sp. TaxID=2864959 RepID=UPI0035D40C37
MSHGIGVTAALREVPDAVLVVFVLVTQLGDVWFYLSALVVAYAFADALPRVGAGVRRERVAFVVAVAVGAVALTAWLKLLFAHPRPPGAGQARELVWLPDLLVPLWEEAATGDGFALPSGHATGSAAIYGAAALALKIGRRRIRYAAAACIVGLVALSRVVIGVHYIGDVVAGVVVGSGYLAGVWLLTGGQRVKRAFSLATLVALGAAATHFGVETAAALGAALGGRIGWTIVGGRLPVGPTTRREGAVATLVGLGLGGALLTFGLAGETAAVGFLTNALAVAAVLSGPLVAARLTRG